MKKIFLIVLVLSVSFSSCEKDDICDGTTSTTPKLIVEFYDALEPTVLKNVTNLKVKEAGISNFLLFNGASKIQIPLKTTDDFTNFSFIMYSTDPLASKEDVLQFNYARQNIFISRACGFKTIFALNATSPIVLNGNPLLTEGNWIKDIEVIQPNINDENETHIKIYF